MKTVTQKSFSAEIAELKKMIEWVRSYLIQVRCKPFEMRRIELALEEALVNVIEHAYQKKGGLVDLTFQLGQEGFIEIQIKDHGPPFNPIKEVPKLNHSPKIEDREEGKLGIYLMTQMVDEVRYTREGEYNILVLRKKMV